MHSLVLVLSSAHSGATQLCDDISSIGGLGLPKEYLRGLGRTPAGTASEADVLERVAMGVQDDAPGVASVQLMVPQMPVTYEALSGQRLPAVEALPGIIDWAKERFERLFVVFLVRNAIDQTISSVVADATGNLRPSDRAIGDPRATEIPNINQLILANLWRIVRDRRVLLDAHGKFADIGLLLTYDELDREPAETGTKLVAHARKSGFEVKHESVQREPGNVTDVERATEIREGFLEYLRSETGVQPGGLGGSGASFTGADPADQ